MVAAVEAVVGVDASLAAAGSISGVVTDSEGAPIEGIYVYAASGGSSAYTAADGSYRLSGLSAASYVVQFRDFSGEYLGEWFDDAADQESAAVVEVAEGEAIAGVDACVAAR